jgi:hypothetical protein
MGSGGGCRRSRLRLSSRLRGRRRFEPGKNDGRSRGLRVRFGCSWEGGCRIIRFFVTLTSNNLIIKGLQFGLLGNGFLLEY